MSILSSKTCVALLHRDAAAHFLDAGASFGNDCGEIESIRFDGLAPVVSAATPMGCGSLPMAAAAAGCPSARRGRLALVNGSDPAEDWVLSCARGLCNLRLSGSTPRPAMFPALVK